MIVIAMSSIGLACEDPVNEASTINYVLSRFDIAFTAVFSIEMSLKVSFTECFLLSCFNLK